MNNDALSTDNLLHCRHPYVPNDITDTDDTDDIRDIKCTMNLTNLKNFATKESFRAKFRHFVPLHPPRRNVVTTATKASFGG